MSISYLILGIFLTSGSAVGEDKENSMALTPNRPVIADGLGRLPQFSHATVAGELIFVSGTLGTLGEAFDLAPGGTGPQTTQTLRNIETVLRAAGADLGDVVKVSVYLADMSTFQEMNEAYSKFFPEAPPARITVGGAVLALGAAVEIECIARHVP
jgi:2-iminobutanoate/2-iminopropanoate deaminase